MQIYKTELGKITNHKLIPIYVYLYVYTYICVNKYVCLCIYVYMENLLEGVH